MSHWQIYERSNLIFGAKNHAIKLCNFIRNFMQKCKTFEIFMPILRFRIWYFLGDELKVGKIQVCWSLNWQVGLSMCDQLKNCDWQLFSLFAEDQAEADFQHTQGIYAIYGPNLDLIFFLLLVLVAESDLGKGSNFCHRFLLTSIIYQNKHTDRSCRKCKFKR